MPIGPSRPLHLTKPESIDIRQAARYFGARGEADSATLALLERCAAPLLAAATPRAVWLEADVESLAQVGILKGEDIFRHLEGCREALLLAVTLGPGADSQIRRAGVGDIAAGVASDALGSALAEQAADAAEAGLCVTENDLMTPRKSVTALLGLSDHPVKGHLAGCGHCVLNTRCEYRKRGKTCASE